MADEPIPQEIIAWIDQKNWGAHHDQWHFERRWDFWHALAATPGHPAWIDDMIRNALANEWTRHPLQEGAPGNGEDFLFMHRAMFQLLAGSFPGHSHFFRGWHSPPQSLNDPDDPVPPVRPGEMPNPAKGDFDSRMSAAIQRVEARMPEFDTEDAFGLFLQTNHQPTPQDPLARNPDDQAGLHNYLHNRWSDNASPINLGAPTVNTKNHRFWKLHGWIDHLWWKFRRAKGLNDSSAGYQDKLRYYLEMMNMDGHPGHAHHAGPEAAGQPPVNIFLFDAPPPPAIP